MNITYKKSAFKDLKSASNPKMKAKITEIVREIKLPNQLRKSKIVKNFRDTKLRTEFVLAIFALAFSLKIMKLHW